MNPTKRFNVDAETVATAALLGAALAVALATAKDYGIAVDEFNTDDYGPKALAWYTSGFVDRSHFETVEEYLWYYGPWFQMLTAAVQSFGLADPITVRHAVTFMVGLAGLAAIVPIARLVIGRWAGLSAIVLCLMTGYLYGSLFFTPIDVPFLAVMTWATLAIILMARRAVPSWPATIAAGLFTGLAMATRTGGIITHAYLFGAMALSALEAVVRYGGASRRLLYQIGTRTLIVVAMAWLVAVALWPWLQIGNPFSQFKIALLHFTTIPMSFSFLHWGETVWTNDLPRSYIPGQLFARLPEAFLLLLLIGLALGLARASGFVWSSFERLRSRGTASLRAPAMLLARSRAILIVWAAVILPLAFLIIQRATQYDSVRHVLFVIPMLAVIASFGFVRVLPLLKRIPALAAVLGGAHLGKTILTLALLHPLEYIALNAFAGGVKGGYDLFELDYWAVAATEAVRRLEQRIAYDPKWSSGRVPSIMICISFRESRVEPILQRPWRIETDPQKADFVIETQRWRCIEKTPAILVDEVKRFDRSFAWTYERKSPRGLDNGRSPVQSLSQGS